MCWDWSDGLSTEIMKAGGRGGGANGDVKTPIRSRVGEGDCIIEAGRLLPFRSKVSTSAFVKIDVLLVWLYAEFPLPETSFSVAARSSDDLREGGGVISVFFGWRWPYAKR